MTTAEKILDDCSGDRNLQIYALSNALSVTEKERDAIAETCDKIAADHALILAENERLKSAINAVLPPNSTVERP